MDIEQMRIRMGEMAAEIERLQSVIDSQSPAVSVPDYFREEWKRNVMLMWSCVRKYDSSIPSDVLDFMRESMFKMLKCYPSPRITDKDAGEILLSYGVEYIGILQWLKDNGRSTLAKLNEVSHETN